MDKIVWTANFSFVLSYIFIVLVYFLFSFSHFLSVLLRAIQKVLIILRGHHTLRRPYHGLITQLWPKDRERCDVQAKQRSCKVGQAGFRV